jgi:tetratricopeptide (TPR) repeat protein
MASKRSRRGLVAQGKLDEALKSYRDGLVIAKRLAASDCSNTGWQRDLSVLYNSIGDVLVAQGKLDEALKSYRDSLAIAQRLAASDRSNTGWQRDLSVLYEGIEALEEHKRFVLGRETRDADRIRRFAEVQRRKRRWIRFAEIAEWGSELGGSGPNEAACKNFYTLLQRDLLAGRFEEYGRSQVLFLFPGVTNRRMTQQWLQDAIDNNYDNQNGRSWLENCWLPQNVFARWRAWHHLPESPLRFQPTQGKQPTQPSDTTTKSSAPKNLATRQPQSERARRALEALFGSKVPDAAALSNKLLGDKVNKWLKACKEPPVGQRTIQRAAGRK